MTAALLLALVAAVAPTPEVVFSGSAGPYALSATVQLPEVVPGLAQIEVHSQTPSLRRLQVLALPLESRRAAFPPTPDEAQRAPSDAQAFTGQLWLMSTGSWQIRLLAEGDQGPGEVSIPVSALPTRVTGMPRELGAVLFGLLAFLALGLVSIARAAAAEGQLPPGERPDAQRKRRGWRALVIAAVAVLGVVTLGDLWWDDSAADYAKSVYKPLVLTAQTDAPGVLDLAFSDPGWRRWRKLDDFIGGQPGGHPVNLYVLQSPDLERVWHLYPERVAAGRYRVSLPDLPGGQFELLAQVVHANGLPETLRARVELPPNPRAPLKPRPQDALLPDGARLVWVGEAPLRAGVPQTLKVRVTDASGPIADASGAEALLVRDDLSLLVPLWTTGTVPPASLNLANPDARAAPGAAEVAFPYRFAAPGQYRLFMEVRRLGHPATGALDLKVE